MPLFWPNRDYDVLVERVNRELIDDIIDTYVYRSGIESLRYSFATAVGLFKAIIAALLLLGSNFIAKRLGHTGIW